MLGLCGVLAVSAPPAASAQDDNAPPPPAAPAHPGGGSFIERFHRANVTNDGRLTLDQARAAGMHMIVNHFEQIDTEHKGFVTLDDIRVARTRLQAHQSGGEPPPPQ